MQNKKMIFSKYFKLMRVSQWYKNLLVFLPIIFVNQLFNIESLLLTMIGFFSLCFISSSNYIINDIIDLEKDRVHPEKRKRPLASKKISIFTGLIFLVLSFTLSIYLALKLNNLFLNSVLALFVLTQIYTFFLKKEAFVDIILIGVNFVIRASAGAFIIGVIISPWLIIGVFFLALFLSVGKREADLIYLGKTAQEHKKVLSQYTPQITRSLMNIATTLLIMSYTLYSFLSEKHNLILTLPFALYVIFRYYYLVGSGSKIARHPEYGFKDIRLIIGSLFWLSSTLILLYY